MRSLITLFILISFGCTKKQHRWGDICEGKPSCPEVGHGACPFCFDPYDINNVQINEEDAKKYYFLVDK